MHDVSIAFQHHHRLGNETNNTGQKKTGIRWNLFTNLDDLNFADDLALLSHTHTPTTKRKPTDYTSMQSKSALRSIRGRHK